MVVMLVIFVIAMLGLAAFFWFVLTRRPESLEPGDAGDEVGQVLRYVVPEGQDPAALLAVLHPNGYRTRLADNGAYRVLVILCPTAEAEERATVRELIGHADSTIQDPATVAQRVRFEDEEQGSGWLA